MTVSDLATREGVISFAEGWMNTTIKVFNAQGQLHHHAIVFGTITPDGQPLGSPAPHIIQADDQMARDGDTKDRFRDLVRYVALKTKAVGVMMVMEVWLRVADPDDARRIFESGSSIAEDPKRTEAIFVSLDHLANPHTLAWTARITRAADGTGTISAFKPVADQGRPVYEGRFTTVFPRELYS